MQRRWKILIAVASLAVFADQASKYLAVTHLTPAVARHVSDGQVMGRAHARQLVKDAPLSDKLTGWWAAKHPCSRASHLCPEIIVFEGLWSWSYRENPGAAFSILASAPEMVRRTIFISLAFGVLIFLVFMIRGLPPGQTPLLVALSFVFGGAIGNLIDRIHRGYVVDFARWTYEGHAWPTFNVADSFLVAGAILLAILQIQEWLQSRRESDVAPHEAKEYGGDGG